MRILLNYGNLEKSYAYIKDEDVIIPSDVVETTYSRRIEIGDFTILHNLDKEFDLRVTVELLSYDLVNRHSKLRGVINLLKYRNWIQDTRYQLLRVIDEGKNDYDVVGGLHTHYGDVTLIYLGDRRRKPIALLNTRVRNYIYLPLVKDVQFFLIDKVKPNIQKETVDNVLKSTYNELKRDKRSVYG